MAIPRMFNSNTPFIEVKGGSGLSFVVEENGVKGEEENNLLIQTIAPHLSLLMEHGTAKQVGTGGQGNSEETPYVSIIAQAEGEGCQEFSPTSTEYPFSRPHLPKRSIAKQLIFTSDTDEDEYAAPHKVQYRPLRRKHRKRPNKKRRRRDEGEEPPVIQGLWVQEIDWLRSTDKEPVEAPDFLQLPVCPQHTDSNWNPCSTRGYSSEGVSKPSRHGRVSATCSSCADVCDNGCGLNDMLLSDSHCGLREVSDSSCSSEDLGVSESLCTHESESDSSICIGGVSDSVCSIMDVSDCLSSIMCVSDDFLVQRGASGSLMGVSDLTSTCSLEHVSGSASSEDVLTNSSSHSLEEVSGSSCSLDGVPNSACGESESVKGLRGRVTQRDLRFASTFFKEVVREALVESDRQPNEGLMFHKELRVCKSEYREGKQYHILHHIQNGSFGDVFCVQDKSTGFECAAKRIPLSHFSSEEVSTWIALDSPRVVELFGAVREGMNITLFMDLKPGCLAHLLRERGSLPENLALHYLHQLLGALEHLHHRHVLHLDVKVDNVLLSVDGMDTFLCDFGLSETTDSNFQSTNTFIGPGFPGTESHMAPEVARGDLRCAKADVWSSCCMLLHMLNGCHPWIRYYSHPLCLKIVSEPAPLWEVPASCNHFTAEVFKAGLQKDPIRRASATDLRKRTTHALRAVGGLCSSSIKSEKQVNSKAQNGHTSRKSFRIPSALDKQAVTKSASTMQWVSPWRAMAADEDSIDSEEGQSEWKKYSESESDSMEAGGWESHSSSFHNLQTEDNDWEWETDSEVDIYLGEEEYSKERVALGNRDDERDYEGDLEEEESEWNSSSSTELFRVLQAHFPVLRKGQPTRQSWGSEPELEYLRDGVTVGSVAQTPSPEPRDHPPSCLSNTDDSYIDATDKDSDRWSDDLSSGIFSSYNSQTDGHMEWLLSTNQTQSHCFEGVDIWIENIGGECLRIRERRQVKVGHVAIGISEQITAKAFSMETLDRKTVSFQQEIQESGLWLRCVPAPDGCQLWNWRIKEGKLEIRD
ncbi:mitogen-activated protein kinase kinase kinase 14 isoform X1 [Hypomesus transpacificus]|uniref:mitogen-activated protein kinase kinase kinase 14 isoform X1 n=1 Tax=Hypomesus transpacificus TaxID=137520 RepID=UPI001F086F85|nr:mitogen-activated protein kinase kinase kinase 14 isoform X1 [Hypomesus transpacificus]XP_046888175.1 mitogen-activated protein kinase kinase kinase 14 isoform X1 [Hypomesus transpacificus]